MLSIKKKTNVIFTLGECIQKYDVKFNGNRRQRKYDADFNGNVLGDARQNDMYKTIVATTSHSLQSFPDKSLPHLLASTF